MTTIEEANEMRKQLEQKIFTLVKDYEKKTGLEVYEIVPCHGAKNVLWSIVVDARLEE